MLFRSITLKGFLILVTNIRGIDSYGMLCSESELGLSDESQGITELDSKKFKIGIHSFPSRRSSEIGRASCREIKIMRC